jgi:SAM-dependent methyltransferase
LSAVFYSLQISLNGVSRQSIRGGGKVLFKHTLMEKSSVRVKRPMGELRAEKLDYGNWVSSRLLFVVGMVGVLFLVLSFVFLVLIFGAVFFVLIFVYFMYARFKFSQRGGNIQALIQELVLDHLDWDGEGRAIDIGCGNGPLTIMIAKKFHNANVTGIDYWGGMWGYSKSVCVRNAEIEGVVGRVNFQKASASTLPFDDEFFDAAVSNFVFHEVSDTKNKRDLIKEALRVVKKGGKFAFQDLFLAKRVYGEVDDLLETIRSWGIESVEFLDTSHSDFIPKALKLQFMLGKIGILYGKK